MDDLGGVGPRVAVTLNCYGSLLQIHTQVFQSLLNGVNATLSRRLISSQGSTHGDGLAGNDTRNTVPVENTVGIHDPGHRFRIGIYIGSGYILFRTYEGSYLVGVPPRQSLQFPFGHLLGIALDPTLCSTVGDIYHRRLPRHPCRQGLHLIQIDAGVVTNSPLCRSPRVVMLDSVSGKDLEFTAIHRDWKGDD